LARDVMVYGRIASGYRIGGPNANGGLNGIPEGYKPDKTTNFELGVKGEFLEHRLNIDASVYHISWHDFQVAVLTPQFNYFLTNAGDAESNGVELSVQARPGMGLTISAQASYNDAKLTQDMPADAVRAGSFGLNGDKLPYSIPWSGGFAVNQDIPVTGGWTGFVGGAVTYVGRRRGEFASDAASLRPQMSAYTMLDLRAGVRFNSWLLNLYLNNVANERGVVGVWPTTVTGVTGGYYGTIIQPRTLGLSVSRNFQRYGSARLTVYA